MLIAQPLKNIAVIIIIMPSSDSDDSSATTLEEESEVALSVPPHQAHQLPHVSRQKPPLATNSEEDSFPFLLLHFLVAAISSHPQPLAVVTRDIILATQHLIVHLLPMLPRACFAHRQSLQRKHTALVHEE